jgi:translation initiation factor IF-2
VPVIGKPPSRPAPPKKQQEFQPKRQEGELKEFRRKSKAKYAKRKERKRDELAQALPEKISVPDVIQVRELAERLNRNPAEIVKKLMALGMLATINQEIDFETAEIVASEYEVEVERERPQEEILLGEVVDSEESLVPRPPVVTVMGHVDHGKTSLLDAIRMTNVVAGEAGGITQHIGAYQVEVNDRKITFIDTPGHEAFTAMRARGAQATDIAILVVAADDGVMPQTVEAINHARAAGVPVVVAVNKIDKPDANPDRVKQQLAEYGLVPEEWGGDTVMAPVSAKTRVGIPQLLEMVLLVADMKELKANPNRPAEGVVIEGRLDKGRGPVATMLVQKGTLRVGDTVLCGLTWGKVRAMNDHLGNRVEEAPPSFPVEVVGMEDVPMAGDTFRVVDEKLAKTVAALRMGEKKREEQMRTAKVTLDDFFKSVKEGQVKELNLIIKGDVQGSIEALSQSLLRLSTDEVKVNVIHSGVGAITESDVMLAAASNAIIIGFNVRPDVKSRKYAEEMNIDVRLYRVIYEAIDDVKKAMSGLLAPEKREVFQGRAEVRATFKVPKAGTVAGCYMLEGKITRNSKVRVLRDGVIIFEGHLSSLKRFKDDVREVLEGYECGVGVADFNDIKEGDIIEAFVIEEVAREL